MIVYITGTSSGIGKAIAEKLLERKIDVVGMSRRQTIKHPNYQHIEIDLSDLERLKAFSFPADYKNDIVLINNSGTIGPIKPIGQQITEEIVGLNNLNITAPQVLGNKFIYQYQGNDTPNYQIINISSGAGKRPIDAWATYCASKAAIDLFSETISEELKLRKHYNWKVYSIAPGVVDTNMQSTIRESNPRDFLKHQDFLDLKNNGDLVSPAKVADTLVKLILNPHNEHPVIFSLKEYR